MIDREAVLTALARIERQVRLDRLVKAASIGVPAMLVPFLVSALLPGSLAPVFVLLWIAGWVGWVCFKVMRRGNLAHAAEVADARADLKDEIKTAYWFIRKDASSPWIDFQISRAARTSGGVDPAALVPVRVPRGPAATSLLLVALTIVFTVWPRVPRAETEDALSPELAALLPDARAVDEEKARELEKTLKAVEKGELSREAGLRALDELQDLLEEGNLDAQALREGLDEMANELKGTPALDALAEALRNRDLKEAAELLRKLAQNAGALDEARKGLERAASKDSLPLDKLLEQLKKALEGMDAKNQEQVERALQDAAQSLEKMGEKLDAQQEMNAASQKLEDARESMARDKLDPKQQGQMSEAKRRSGPALEGGAVALPGETAGAEDKKEGEEPLDGSSSGLAAGRSQGGADAPGESTRLDVQLAMEKIEAPPKPLKPEDEEIIKETSREEHSVTEYENVPGRSRYANEKALHAERIPWAYRTRVKEYFLSIKPPDR